MVLITGSNSSIGTALTARLIQEKVKIRCFDYSKLEYLHPGVEYIEGDILDEKSIIPLLKDIETVFHLKEVQYPGSRGRRFMKKINIKGSLNILKAAEQAGVSRFILLSSHAVYGRQKIEAAKPDIPYKPLCPYGHDKMNVEKLCREHERNYGLPVTILRAAIFAGEKTRSLALLIFMYILLAPDDEKSFYMSGDGETRVQLIHPDDAASALILAMDSESSIGNTYNIGADDVQTQLELAEEIRTATGLVYEIKQIPVLRFKMLSILFAMIHAGQGIKELMIYLKGNLIMDCTSTKDDLNWEPGFNNTDLMLETVKWYREEKLKIN